MTLLLPRLVVIEDSSCQVGVRRKKAIIAPGVVSYTALASVSFAEIKDGVTGVCLHNWPSWRSLLDFPRNAGVTTEGLRMRSPAYGA